MKTDDLKDLNPPILNKNVIRIYGDSISMPRIFEGVSFLETYPELIKYQCQALWGEEAFLYNRSRYDATIRVISQELRQDTLNFGKPGGRILIVQVGICDCAPRPIPDFIKDFISRVSVQLRIKLVSIIHHNRARIQKRIFWRETKEADFESMYINLIKDYAQDFERVYVINIPPTNNTIEKHSPGLSRSISLYNGLIFKAVKINNYDNVIVIDVFKAISETNDVNKYIIEKDGHHLTADGHLLYASMIIDQEKTHLLTEIS